MAERKLVFLGAEGFPEEQTTTDTATFGGLTLGGDIAMGTNKVTGLADGTAAADAVNKGQLDLVEAGVEQKDAVDLATDAALPANTAAGSGVGKTLTADAVGVLTVDGVATVLNDRIMVKDETGGADVDHGIYDVTTEGTAGVAFVLTRATDFDGTPAGEVKTGSAAFVLGGTANANTGWRVSTADPITVDTTPIAFVQFQALPNFVFGAGLLNTANTISVELDTAAAAQTAGVGGGSSGLEFDAGGDAGKVRAAVNATAGLERTASGLGARLNGGTLVSAAAGLSVAGLPLQFEINAVATTVNVTAANLNELTGGGSTTLHSHAGAAEAERVETNYTSDGTGVTIGDPVFVSANNVITRCNANNDNTRQFVGLAKATVGAAASVDVVGAGVLAGVTVAGSPAFGVIVYLVSGGSGGLTTVRPVASGDHSLVVGKMKNATDIDSSKAQYLGKAS